jgi:hypothetical protein
MGRMAGHQCPCGRLVTLHTDDDGTPEAWGVIPVNDPAEMEGLLDDGILGFFDRARVNRATFTEVTICECGRRYRAMDAPPWIVACPSLDEPERETSEPPE